MSASTSPTSNKKIILVFSGTGAQGLAVIKALVAPSKDGTPSPWAVRLLTRNPSHERVKALLQNNPDIEVFKGSFLNFDEVLAALDGVYGAFVNTDGFTVGEEAETFAGLRIFELAKQVKTVKHYVWSNLDYSLKKGNYDPQYKVGHYDGKGRIAEWMTAQPSEETGMTWSVLTTGPYMDMLNVLFAPVNKRADGTVVFAAPIGNGHVPMIALSDLGWWARYIFDNRAKTSGKDLEVASEIVSWPHLVETFTRVTGQPAAYVPLTLDAYWDTFTNPDIPVANALSGGTTFRENFSGFWAMWRDDIVKRDMEWIKSVHPGTVSLEQWIRETRYVGARPTSSLLKNVEDGHGPSRNREKLAHL
ncbi:hypothetical protein BOTBODRAFT_26361 [Botryobasidium botryosum FD-172 SS1]|uniref:NmrA-like domain-containing protein n=1 Tax=Botryobasidium botryosum (strain FD-172 SS1) TaxID=930990 RepID=A0A067NCV8_BOTB1|nr:hypothetical protein BOTBODRAFT_26361 [Botryobasidium botryosum FD-172 SS1]